MNKLTNIVNVPSSTRLPLFKYMEDKKIEYKVLTQDEIPFGMPAGCTFRGVDYINGVIAIESELTKEEIYNFLDKKLPKNFKQKYRN